MRLYLNLEKIDAFQWDGSIEMFDKIQSLAKERGYEYESVDDLFFLYSEDRIGAWICIGKDTIEIKDEEPLNKEGLKKIYLELTGK